MKINMDIEKIKSLLARFYEGQTTPEEERLLADFFYHENVSEDLQQDKQLFFILAQTAEMPSEIAKEITDFVNNLGQTKLQPLIPEDKQNKVVIPRLKTPPKTWYRVAATVALLLALGGGIWMHQNQTAPFRDTCSTPEEAAIAIIHANKIVNRSLASFQQSTSMAKEQINEMNETINKVKVYINQ